MNIFAVSSDVVDCAQSLDNIRLNKMTVETAQLVSTALYYRDPFAYRIRGKLGRAYKLSYQNHPCSVWARNRSANFWWLVNLGIAYSNEYTYRFEKIHGSQKVFEGLAIPKIKLPTNWVDCSNVNPTLCNDPTDIHEKYQICLMLKWDRDIKLPKWTKREPPWFFNGK
jgi:hypothetical protein